MGPYRPIGVPVSIQVSDSNLPSGLNDEEEEYFDDDQSDPLAYRESNGEHEDSELTPSPLPNGEWIPERPLEPIMFEVHHQGDSQVASAAESPQTVGYQPSGTESEQYSPDAKVLNGVEYYHESSNETQVRTDDDSFPPTAVVCIENEAADYSDSEAEPEPEANDLHFQNKTEIRESHFEQHETVHSEPEAPRPLFSTEQVMISYEKEPYAAEYGTEIEEVENVASEMKVQESVPEMLLNPESSSLGPKENESGQSVELDSNGLPMGAMIPLTNSNESFNSDNTTDDHPASEIFHEDTAVQPAHFEDENHDNLQSGMLHDSKVSIENVREIQNASMMETLEIITTDVEPSNEPYINGEGHNYEPTLQIAPRVYQPVFIENDSARYSESDAAMYEDFNANELENQHDRLPNGTASNTLEELSVDTNAPTVDLDSTEVEYHSGSSNCAEFMVNSLTPDYLEHNSGHAHEFSPDLPSPSFPEPIEENEPEPEPEEADDPDPVSQVESEPEPVTEVYQPTVDETEKSNAEENRHSIQSSGGSSLIEPLNYQDTAENVAEAAIKEASLKVSEDDPTRTSVHFNVEEEPNTGTESPSTVPEKLMYVDDVNTTESDKTSYDNVPMDDLLDYDENTRSDQVEDLSASPHHEYRPEAEDATELPPPPLVHLDSVVSNDYDYDGNQNENVDIADFLPPEPIMEQTEPEPQFQEVISNIALEPVQRDLPSIPMEQLYSVPTQSTVESSSEDDDDEEGLSAIEEEPSLTTQDGEESTPPPIPDRSEPHFIPLLFSCFYF